MKNKNENETKTTQDLLNELRARRTQYKSRANYALRAGLMNDAADHMKTVLVIETDMAQLVVKAFNENVRVSSAVLAAEVQAGDCHFPSYGRNGQVEHIVMP